MIHVEKAIRRLRAAFPAFACGPDTVALYAEKLAGIAPHAVEAAVDQAIEGCDRFPAIADILKFCQKPEYYQPFQPLPDWTTARGDDRNSCGGVFTHGVLIGQRWEKHELHDSTGKRGFPNAVYYRAARAAAAAMRARLDEHAAKRAASQPTAQAQPEPDDWEAV